MDTDEEFIDLSFCRRTLPRIVENQLDHAFDGNDVIKEALGPAITEAFLRAKWSEVEESRMKVTDWELERYLEVA